MGEKQHLGVTVPDYGGPLSEKELCPVELLALQEAAFARDIERLLARREEFLEVACPACAGADWQPAFEKHSICYRSCRSCRTIYASPRPSAEVLSGYYAASENYKIWAERIFPSSEAVRREKIHKVWLKRVQTAMAGLGLQGGDLVEVGPGFGTFAELARDSGLFDSVRVVEPTPELAEACRKRGLAVLQASVEDVPKDFPQADVLCCFEVLEHLFDPAAFLARAAGLLRPGGLLVVSCPNGLGFDVATLGALSLAVDPEHINLFNPGSLSGLLASCGFEPLDVSTPGRLDAEFVREEARKGAIDLSGQPLLKRILLDEWERLGWPFQEFLAANRLSSHMWASARRMD